MAMRIFAGIVSMVLLTVLGFWFLAGDKDTKSDTIMARVTPIPTQMPIQKFTKLIAEDTKEGTGSAVKSGDTIVIHYLGTLTNGDKFDSSYDRGQPFVTQIGVGRVIRGWDEGVIGMKAGGKRTLKIPSEMGYGARGAGGAIPPNADLIFEVELLEIKN